VDRRKVEFPKLLSWITEMIYKYSDCLDMIYIENKSSGQAAIQSLKDSADPWISDLITSINPESSKEVRGYGTSVWAENGCILLPPDNHPDYPWLQDFCHELFLFPSGKYKDMVDSLDQMVLENTRNLAEGLRSRSSKGGR
jgi:predicted phage terminase large subunit-like protein